MVSTLRYADYHYSHYYYYYSTTNYSIATMGTWHLGTTISVLPFGCSPFRHRTFGRRAWALYMCHTCNEKCFTILQVTWRLLWTSFALHKAWQFGISLINVTNRVSFDSNASISNTDCILLNYFCCCSWDMSHVSGCYQWIWSWHNASLHSVKCGSKIRTSLVRRWYEHFFRDFTGHNCSHNSFVLWLTFFLK